MIIWVASYPKSGNTWIRSIISSYFYSEDGLFNFNLLKNISQYPASKYFNKEITKPGEVSFYWKASQEEIVKNKKDIFLKTHNALVALNGRYFTSESHTLGAIYIIRDPRNVITSLKNHYDFKDYEDAFNFLTNQKKYLWDERKKNEYSGFQFLGSWSDHYKSWIHNKMFKILLIKYEDLQKDTYSCACKIIEFILSLKGEKIEINNKKILNCIESTKFDLLKKKENESGFSESVSKNKKKRFFFYLGPNNKWQQKLSSEILSKVEKQFKEDLEYFNYSDLSGNVN